MGRRILHSYIKLAGNIVEVTGGTPGPIDEPPVVTDAYDIVVGLIQSNMRGVATDYDSSDQFPAGVYMWNHSTSTIVPATEPLSTPEVTVGMGASNTFLKDYAATSLANGRKLLMVNTARGGTGFTTPSTNTTSSGFHWRYDLANDSNNLARRAVDAINAAVAAAGPDSRIVALIANHGSTDGSNNTPKATFKAYLQAWITWVRNELDVNDVPYVMMQMRPSLLVESRHLNLDNAQTETAAEMNLVGKATSPNGSQYNKADSVHFNAAGMRIIGHNMYTVWDGLAN